MIPLKLTISSIALIFLTAVMSGCAMGWTKDEPYTQQDWLRDRYACERDTMYLPPNQSTSMYISCLQSKGWYLTTR